MLQAGGSLIQYDWCPYPDMHGKHHVKMETEIGLMRPQAKEHDFLAVTGR